MPNLDHAARRLMRVASAAACLALAVSSTSPVAAGEATLPSGLDERMPTCVVAVMLTEKNRSTAPKHRLSFAKASLLAHFLVAWTATRSADEGEDALMPYLREIQDQGDEVALEQACLAAYPEAASIAPVTLPANTDEQLLGCATLAQLAAPQYEFLGLGTPYPQAASYRNFLARADAHSEALEAASMHLHHSAEKADYYRTAMSLLKRGRLDKVLDACLVALPKGAAAWG
ncbi:MAG: hypothetical protein JSR45_18480 [Proteobacteria bacterium]|nr:hypothetical protein [Pseudomonadota bacterium]